MPWNLLLFLSTTFALGKTGVFRRHGIDHCANRAAASTTKGQGRNPREAVQDGWRVLMRRGRRNIKVVLQCADEADQISVLGGFLKPNCI